MVIDVYCAAVQVELQLSAAGTRVNSRALRAGRHASSNLHLHAVDVMHSFWVPEWRIKRDVVPGNTDNEVVRHPRQSRATTPLLCTELYRIGHATMRAPVVVRAHAGGLASSGQTSQPPIKADGGKAAEKRPNGPTLPEQIKQ